MTNKVNIRTVNNHTGNYTTTTLHGRNYMVVPSVPVREQVMNTYYVPQEELQMADSWNGTPITVRHPQKNNGSANVPEPDVAIIGRFFNGSWDDVEKRVTGEYWIDVDEAMRTVEGQYVVNAIRMGQVLETSTGYWADEEVSEGIFNERQYSTIHRHIKPDHIAILVDEIGACSVADGCGMNRNSLYHNHLYHNCDCDEDANSHVHAQGGRGSGDFGHLGRPGQVGGSQGRTLRKKIRKKASHTFARPLDAYYVTSKNNKSRYSSGWKGKASLMSPARARDMFDTLERGGFEPVIFEIKLPKGGQYLRFGSNTVVVPSVSGDQVHEIDIETLKKKKQSRFHNSFAVDNTFTHNLDGSLIDELDNIRSGFYNEFSQPVEQQSVYIKDIFDDHVIASMGEDMYKVKYKKGSSGYTFAQRDDWKPVSLKYVEDREYFNVRVPTLTFNVTGNLPASAKQVYERVYSAALKKYKGDKAKASKIAWGAVKKTWKQDKDGHWVKKNTQKGIAYRLPHPLSLILNSTQSKENNRMKKKLNLQSVLDAFRKNGISVTTNDDENIDGEMELELEVDEVEDEEETPTVPTLASPFTEEEISALRKLLTTNAAILKYADTLDKLPTVLELVHNAEAEKATKKSELVALILNASSVYSKEELETMSLPILTKLYGQSSMDYAGAAGGQSFLNSDADSDDILTLPSVSFLTKENT